MLEVLTPPTDEISSSDKFVEIAACKRSLAYFVGTYVQINDPLKGRIKFELWPVHQQLIDLILDNQRLVILKARQVGVSWLLASYALWRATFSDGANILMLSKREDEAKALLGKSYYVYQHLPLFLRRKIYKKNESELTFSDYNNGSVAATSIKAFPSTEDAGRSEAASDVICDEWAYHPFAEANYGAYKPTIDSGGKLIGVSTANGVGNFYHRIYIGAKETDGNWREDRPAGKNGFVPLFVPWYARPSRDDKWYARQIAEYSETPHLLAQEYPASDIDAFISSGNGYFNKEKIHMWMQFCRGPVYSELGGAIRKWKLPMYGEKYVAGADCAEGRGEDMSGCAIYHYRTMEHVADLHGDFTPDEFAYMLYTLLREYNHAFICCERNSVGVSVILDLTKKYDYRNVMRTKVVNSALKLGRASQKEYLRSEEYGWSTNTITRPMMLKDLANSISSGNIISPDKAFWEECLSFVNIKGKLQAAEGCKDDRVFKHALAVQAALEFPSQDITQQSKQAELILRGSL